MERKCEQRERERVEGGILYDFWYFRWNFTVADMDLSVIEGIEGSEFNCGVSPVLTKLRFQVDTLRGVLFAIDRYTQQLAELVPILCYNNLTIVLFLNNSVWILVVVGRSCGRSR